MDTNQSSAPATDTDNESVSNVAIRLTRPRKRAFDDEMSAVISEMNKSLESFKLQQNSIQESINGIQKQNSEIEKSMKFMEKHYEEMKDKLISMETERRTHLAYIQTLELKVENLERSQKQASIEIRNIPLQKSETKEDLLKIVTKVALATKIPVHETQIRDIFRLNAGKGGNRPIIVDFSSVVLKERILTSVKNHNQANQNNKLNTSHLKLDGHPQPIYIAECLTQKARKLFYLAREFGKKNSYHFCWTAHGKIFLREKVGAASHRIDKESDFDKLQPQTKL